MKKRTKILGTIGPSVDSPELLQEMVNEGLDVVRLNGSHGTWEEHSSRIRMVRTVARRRGYPLPILWDIRGQEIRLGAVESGGHFLEMDQEIVLKPGKGSANPSVLPVDLPQFPELVSAGTTVFLDDGAIELRVSEVKGTSVHCRVLNSGHISSHKSINVPGVSLASLPILTDEGLADLLFGVKQNVEYICVPFVRSAEDVKAVRTAIAEAGGNQGIIAKIENHEGVLQIREIIAASDGVIVARGDLGVELPGETIPAVQKEITALCRRAGKPAIIATQMLESMIQTPRPTRAEVSDIANAVFDGADALTLSGETAAGSYPLECIRTMTRIIQATEEARYSTTVQVHRASFDLSSLPSRNELPQGIEPSISAVLVSSSLEQIATYTPFRMEPLVIPLLSENEPTHPYHFLFGVYPVTLSEPSNIIPIDHNAIKPRLVSLGFITPDDTLKIMNTP